MVMIRSLIVALTIVTVSCASAQEYPPGDPRVTRAEMDGAQVAAINAAWEALHAQHEPQASLSDFRVTYTAVEGRPPTIAFFKPAPIEPPAADGSFIVRTDHRFYQVVIDDHGAHVFVGQ